VKLKRFILFLFLLQIIINAPVVSQTEKVPLYLVIKDNYTYEEIAVRGTVQSDSLSIRKQLGEVLEDLHQDGYLAASIDSIRFSDGRITAFCNRGVRFNWAKVSFDSIDSKVIRKAAINLNRYENKKINPHQMIRDQRKLVGIYENSGYPFASARLARMSFNGNMAEGIMLIEKGPLVRIDSIIIKGNAKISLKYLKKQIGLDKYDLYQEKKIMAISDRIKETTFLREIKPFEIEFRENSADIYTYLEKNRASQFNGIIGIIPNNEITGKLLLTGEVNFSLANLFGRGILFNMDWKKLEPLTQELNINSSYPYIFNSSIGVGINLSLLKQDTTYFRAEPEIELRYFFSGSNWFRLFYMSQLSTVTGSSGSSGTGPLPPFAEYNASLYGAGIRFSKLDYQFNPRRGIYVKGDVSIGSKKIRNDPDLESDIYEGVDKSTTKTVITGAIYAYLPLVGNFVLHLRSLDGVMLNKYLFANELFRLGGIQNIRGMDENSVTASSYVTGSVELRYLFEQQSNLFLFFDGCYWQRNIAAEFKQDTPIGFGIGMNLQTKAGIFTISWALGSQYGNPVNIGTAKVHIGYIQRF
jgi:outer membrane protein assembly factor BamA